MTPSAQDTSGSFSQIAPLLAPVVVICGHYGVGKTSLSVSLALDAAQAGMQVVVSDLDVVNPYFRSSDYKAILEEGGVRLIEPVYARSNLDGPSITNETLGAAEWACAATSTTANEKSASVIDRRLLIVDVGGDDVGARVLGRFSKALRGAQLAVWYVVNRFRGFDYSPEEALNFLHEIEESSQLKASAIVGNSHLKDATTFEVIQSGIGFAQECAALANLPLAFITIPRPCAQTLADRQSRDIRQILGDTPYYDMGVYVKTPWE